MFMPPYKLRPGERWNACMAPDDEEKQSCIECEKVWYSQHYNDGRCHDCTQKGVPGMSVRMKKAERIARIQGIIYAALMVAPVVIIAVALYFGT